MLQRSLRNHPSTMCGCSIINQYMHSTTNAQGVISTQNNIYNASDMLQSLKNKKHGFKAKRSLKIHSNFNNKQNVMAFQLNLKSSCPLKVKINENTSKQINHQQSTSGYQMEKRQQLESMIKSIKQKNIIECVKDKDFSKECSWQLSRIDSRTMKQSFQTLETQFITKLSILEPKITSPDVNRTNNFFPQKNIYQSHLNFNSQNQPRQGEIIPRSQQYLLSHKLDQLNCKETETITDVEDSSFQFSKVINDTQGDSLTYYSQDTFKRLFNTNGNNPKPLKLLISKNNDQFQR